MFAPPSINEIDGEEWTLEDALEDFIHENFAGGIVPLYYDTLLQKCEYSEQQIITKKDELKDLVGQPAEAVLQFDFDLSVDDCDDLTEAHIEAIKQSLIAGFNFIKTHGHQEDFEYARNLMEEVFGYSFEAHFGHPPPDDAVEPAPVPLVQHQPPQEGGRRSLRRKHSRSFLSSTRRKTKSRAKTKEKERSYDLRADGNCSHQIHNILFLLFSGNNRTSLL